MRYGRSHASLIQAPAPSDAVAHSLAAFPGYPLITWSTAFVASWLSPEFWEEARTAASGATLARVSGAVTSAAGQNTSSL